MSTQSKLLIALSLLLAAAPLRAADEPNILLILCDDLGIGDPACYNGDSKIDMPHVNALAKQGVRFTDMHSPSSVCTPTRYGLLTGRYCWRSRLKSGVFQGYDPVLIEPGRVTIASLLKKHGYATGGFGKWHLGLGAKGRTDYTKPLDAGPLNAGFDQYFGIPSSLDFEPYVYVVNNGVEAPPTEKTPGEKHQRQGGKGFWRAGNIAPGFRHDEVLPRTVTEALKFMETRAKAGKPFFMYVPLSSPHTPWLPTEAWRAKSKVGDYGAFTAQTDEAVGQLMSALDRLKVADNTLVIFTSDNGSDWPASEIEKWGHRANGNFRGQKSDAHEGGHRIPFIARWPGKIKPGTTSDQTACLTDVLATIAAAVGDKLSDDAGEDSFNMLPALLGEDGGKPIRPAVVHHSGAGLFAIRSGDWKLITGLGSGGFTAPNRVEPKEGGPKGQLYNLKDDIGEKKNLWLEKPEVVERLTTLLERYKSQGYSNR
jgi:arylsulfatase A-like enzyme